MIELPAIVLMGCLAFLATRLLKKWAAGRRQFGLDRSAAP
jgi:hypothetical protein